MGAGTRGAGELLSYLGEGALGEDAARSSQHDDGDGSDAGRAGGSRRDEHQQTGFTAGTVTDDDQLSANLSHGVCRCR